MSIDRIGKAAGAGVTPGAVTPETAAATEPFRVDRATGTEATQAVTPLETLQAEAPWIAFERDGSNRFGRWMREHLPPGQVRLRVDIFNTLVAMLHTGLGVGVLPTFVAASEPGLVAVSDPIAELETPLWILTHPDLRRTARIQAFMQTVGDALAQRLKAG